jgi:hypothetical protein
MAFLNFEVSLKNITLDANFIFIGVQFLKAKGDASLQALTNSCLPLPLFLI